jgi:hypothetical protein
MGGMQTFQITPDDLRRGVPTHSTAHAKPFKRAASLGYFLVGVFRSLLK